MPAALGGCRRVVILNDKRAPKAAQLFSNDSLGCAACHSGPPAMHNCMLFGRVRVGIRDLMPPDHMALHRICLLHESCGP